MLPSCYVTLFISKNIYLRVETEDSMLTHLAKEGDILKMPIAHAEGRYIPGPEGLESLQKNDQILFRYCNEKGVLFSDNGSTDDIAGICNQQRNVFGMMPHPERASEEILGNTDGLLLLKSMFTAVEQPANV